jgi:uncharacterized protein YpmB
MEEDTLRVILGIFSIIALAISFYFWSANYDECRAMGFSDRYCLTRR